ncbi:hypothetical protein ACH5RR_034720 [Cinchona calisaya]|uniref:DRBM domain-containing protein n=1 Tax=Cinchona calisaya TaxID=153742 RepID=A0ABD2YFM8_9GENT
MPTSSAFQGVSNCYVFKSRLQEFAQKVGLPTPVYDTIKEGPSHVPTFKSTVIVNNVRYDSLPGFYNRKAAEQSAAEVALLNLNGSGAMAECISQPVHETGLCKNLLQEYAQKMNYAIPIYECRKVESPDKASLFSCTVEIGGIKYIGGAARTKKEAEIKAARIALLAIQTNVSGSNSNDSSVYTVVPFKKKVPDLGIKSQKTAAAMKPKKSSYKKKSKKKKHAAGEGNLVQTNKISGLVVHTSDQGPGRADCSVSHDSGVSPAEVADCHYGGCFGRSFGAAFVPCKNGDFNPSINLLNHGGGSNGFINEANDFPGKEQLASTSK